jgi:hypothetical protein
MNIIILTDDLIYVIKKLKAFFWAEVSTDKKQVYVTGFFLTFKAGKK